MNDLLLSSSAVLFLEICAGLVFLLGLLCFFVRRDYIRQIVGFKLMLQGISLGLIITGWEDGSIELSQSIVITALIIEAVVLSMALTMIIHIVHHPEGENGFFAFSNVFRPDRDR
jgi:multisubunit Na+/H+ antiporter MnhC subunit